MSKVQVLDHGYVELVESWGSDERIIEAARMSTSKGFLGWGPKHTQECQVLMARASQAGTPCSCDHNLPGDEKLLRYLYTHKHMTPFEMAGMTIEVQAPIFVFREWHRHRTQQIREKEPDEMLDDGGQSYNELSARYTPLPDVNYVPSIERLMMTSEKNKQAQGIGALQSKDDAVMFTRALEVSYMSAQALYELALERGIPKELARLCIPVGRYSRMRASANLRNWLGFLTLRMDPAAQWEIRQYANAVGDIIAALHPRTWQLFTGDKA